MFNLSEGYGTPNDTIFIHLKLSDMCATNVIRQKYNKKPLRFSDFFLLGQKTVFLAKVCGGLNQFTQVQKNHNETRATRRYRLYVILLMYKICFEIQRNFKYNGFLNCEIARKTLIK